MVYYSFSITNDLGGGYNTTLYDTINIDSAIKANNAICTGTSEDADTLNIHFTKTLSVPAETALNNIISNYTYSPPTLIKATNFIPFTPSTSTLSTKQSGYTLTGSITYPNVGDIKEIEIISFMDNGVTSYDIQIVNKSNNDILAEGNFTNTNKQRNTLSTILNQPSELCDIDISVKINKNGKSTKYVYVYSGMFWY
jgi:hypothetical protein